METLSQIFDYCVCNDLCLPQNSGSLAARLKKRPRARKSPLLLCQISERWRTVALATPRLWTTISVECTKRTVDSRKHLLSTWLLRAGVAPVEVHIFPGREDIVSSGFWRLGSTISAHFDHITELHLHDMEVDAMAEILDPTLSVHALHTLDIETNASASWTELVHGAFTVGHAPRLRHVRLHTPYIWFSHFELSWRQLVTLDLSTGHLNTNDSLQILSLCTALRSYTVFIDHAPYNPNTSPVLVPNLESLSLSSRTTLTEFFSVATFPALKSLAIHRSSDYRMHFEPFRSFFERSAALVEDLKLSGIYMDDADLIACLRHAPAVTRFTSLGLRPRPRGQTEDELYNAMALENNATPILPKLERLTLETRPISVLGTLLTCMLSSRWHLRPWICGPRESVSRLTFVELYPINYDRDRDFMGHSDFDSELDMLRAAGLEISFGAEDSISISDGGGGDGGVSEGTSGSDRG